MDRREFLKTCAALGISVSIPEVMHCLPINTTIDRHIYVNIDGQWLDTDAEWGRDVEFTNYDIDDRKLQEAITVGAVNIREGKAWADCSLDVERAWLAITLEDSKGREWTTADGEQWSCGEMWFNAESGMRWPGGCRDGEPGAIRGLERWGE